jgi:hypothetical protein
MKENAKSQRFVVVAIIVNRRTLARLAEAA